MGLRLTLVGGFLKKYVLLANVGNQKDRYLCNNNEREVEFFVTHLTID